MGTLSLECPLCCKEIFSSRDSLKNHILETLHDVSCPNCNIRFENVYDLTDHLDTECEKCDKSTVADIIKSDHSQDEENDIEHVYIEESHHKEEENESENPESKDDEVTYMCEMCNVQFKSIEEHLDKFHEGEEVLLETEEQEENETENTEGEETEFHGFPREGTFELSNDPIDFDELDKAEEEQQQYMEEREKRSKKFEKARALRKSGTAPITANYQIENGKVKKITEEQAAEIQDHNSIIQIHQCPTCLLQFPKLELYVQHSCAPKKTGKKNKCVHCSATFQSHQSLTAHLKTHVADQSGGETSHKVITLGPHTCDLCNTMFPSFKSLRLHKRMHEPQKNKPVDAPVTEKIGDSEDNVRQMFLCHICNNTYDLEYEQAHMQSHSEEDSLYCATCNRKFLTKENLEMHVKAHTNSKKFICSYCKKAYTNFKALNDHVINHCVKRAYECQYCGRRFSRPCEKVKHERIHTGEKPHICQICGKAFRVSYCLTLHMRTHSGSRPYECKHCKKCFKSHSVYNHHLLIHSDVRAYKCPYCPKAFKTSVQLAGHKNSHIKPFSCTECNRPFASLYAVRAHMETHKRENNLKFDCWLCGATYARAFALKDHMKTQHAGENIGDEVDNIDESNSTENEKFTVEEVELEEAPADQMEVEEVV